MAKRGIGRALLLHTLEGFYRRRVWWMKPSIDSKGLTYAPRLYESVRVETVRQYCIYKKDLPV